MTLTQAINVIEMVAKKQPSVNMIVRNDVFRLNSIPSAKYGVFAWLQGQHSASVNSSFTTLNFTFFYVDRLTADKSNEIEIQSVGMETLDNIIRTLDEYGIFADSYTFQPFNQRFLDECAGVYSSISLNVPNGSLCGEEFTDIDDNNDFLTI